MQGKKIFVIDDDEGLLDTLELILKRKGYQVYTEQNGERVLHGDIAVIPDLFLLDIYIGKINGGDICKHLRAAPATKHIPVILMSASTEMSGLVTASGADAFIEKPFEVKELLFEIERQLQGISSTKS